MKSIALGLLQLYKRWISPAFPPSCRYIPTCSEYAAEAVERYGVVRGGIMAAGRVLRCHPYAQGGLDPVARPENKNLAELCSAPQPGAAVPTYVGMTQK
jgi:putative membrane protein insertion efficiency factor